MIKNIQQELAEVREIMNSNRAIQEKIVKETSERESEKIEKNLANNLGTVINKPDSRTPISQSNSINDYKWKPRYYDNEISSSFGSTDISCSGDYGDIDSCDPSGIGISCNYYTNNKYGFSMLDDRNIKLGLF